jgi:putative transposase
MELAKASFVGGSIRRNVLGKVVGFYDDKPYDFNIINCDCKLIHYIDIDEYILCVPEEIKIQDRRINNHVIDLEPKMITYCFGFSEKEAMKIATKNKIISLDPGTITFMTGLSEKRAVEIAKNSKQLIKNYLIKIDGIKNNNKLKSSRKKKLEKKYNKKITDYVDELHWKSINYLTLRYENILIGDMSSKSIISRNGNMDKMEKIIVSKLKFYQFRKRLEWKCQIRGCNYKCVDEWMTSKMCSNCGKCNNKLGNSRIYKCDGCKKEISRDINGARNIYIKSIV